MLERYTDWPAEIRVHGLLKPPRWSAHNYCINLGARGSEWIKEARVLGPLFFLEGAAAWRQGGLNFERRESRDSLLAKGGAYLLVF